MFLTVLLVVGLFSFSIDFYWQQTLVRLAILPLGVWLTFLIYYFRTKKDGWYRVRPYLWVGFFSNYLFLLITILSSLIFSAVYPNSQLTTYFTNPDDVSLVKTHTIAETKAIDTPTLKQQLTKAKQQSIEAIAWYEDSDPYHNNEKINEKFPYMLTGVKAKWGSGLDSIIFIENNGKGLLIQSEQGQAYYRLSESIWKEGSYQ